MAAFDIILLDNVTTTGAGPWQGIMGNQLALSPNNSPQFTALAAAGTIVNNGGTAFTITMNAAPASGFRVGSIVDVNGTNAASGASGAPFITGANGQFLWPAITNPGTVAGTSATQQTGVALTGGSGSSVQATVNYGLVGFPTPGLNGIGVTSVLITTTGSGYVAGDVLTIPAANGVSGAQVTLEPIQQAGTPPLNLSRLNPAYLGGIFNGYDGSWQVSAITPGVLTGGSAYTNGTYTNVPITGGSGTGMLATIVVSGAAVTAVTITNGGVNYLTTDVGFSALATSIGGTGSGFSFPALTTSFQVYSTLGATLGNYAKGDTTATVDRLIHQNLSIVPIEIYVQLFSLSNSTGGTATVLIETSNDGINPSGNYTYTLNAGSGTQKALNFAYAMRAPFIRANVKAITGTRTAIGVYCISRGSA